MQKILVVDDDAHILELITLYLEQAQFQVKKAQDGEQALKIFESAHIDLAVIDVMMPKTDGITLLKAIKRYRECPVILVTAKGASIDKMTGFNAGSDDYLVKPFDPVELVLRVKALLKRYHIVSETRLTLGSVTLDLDQLQVTTENETIWLKKKEMALLFTLAEEKNRILTRQQLLDRVWGYDYIGEERTVDVHIKRIREQLKTVNAFEIITVRGLGYYLKDVT